MSVDGGFIQANADHHRGIPPGTMSEAAEVREYLAEFTICGQ
jgi:hypothetical protein